MPKLSIIVPVYNVEQYISKCIESILSQSFTDYELILINDGSKDRSGEICDEYAEKDDRICVIHQSNKGVSATRNLALSISKGKYIAFIDSDDWIEKTMFEDMIQTAEESKCELVVCSVNYFDEDNTFLKTGQNTISGLLTQNDLYDCIFGYPNPIGGGCCNKLFKKVSIEEIRFNQTLRIQEDRIFLFDAIENISSAIKLDKALYNVLERNSSATRSDENSVALLGLESSRILIRKARDIDRSVYSSAIVKYLDDCLLCINILKKNHYPVIEIAKIKINMLKLILTNYRRNTINQKRLNGFLRELVK